LDHQRSAEIWRKETNSDTLHPPYGIWRRVDDCAFDALLCWPELEATWRPALGSVRSGWLNGKWRVKWGRSLKIEWSRCDNLSSRPIAEPILERLDAPAPSPWQFIDTLSIARSAWIRDLQENRGRLHLPAGAPLTGFERTMPHLRRADGSAVFLPSKVQCDFHRGESYTNGRCA
jgi:hypothetical protein